MLTERHTHFETVAPKQLLRKMWRRSTPGLFAIALFTLFINVLKLAAPIFILQVLDRVIASRSIETLVMLSIITVIAILCAVVLEMIRRRMLMAWGVWLEKSLGEKLFAHLADRGSGNDASLSEALRDTATLRTFASGTALTNWLDVFWAPFFILCVWFVSPTLGYVVLAASLFSILLGLTGEWLTRDPRNRTRAAGKADKSWVSATERNADSVVSKNMAANVASHWSRSSSERLDAQTKTSTTLLSFSTAMLAVKRLLRVILLAVGVTFVISNQLTLGEVIAAGVLGRLGYLLVERAMSRWRDMAVALKAYKRIQKILAKLSDNEISVPEDIHQQPLVIDKVSFRYPKQSSSLFRNIDIVVEPGEMLCIVGPSAKGKTTLSRLISGVLKPRAGKIRLGDIDIHRLQSAEHRQLSSLLPQQPHIFNGTARENIAGMSEGNIDQIISVAKLLGIHETISNLPSGYDTSISENEPLLSQGQLKLIALARAFYGNPQLIVMDEPFPHLDRQSRSALRKAISKAKERRAIVVVTAQSKSLSRLADTVLDLSGEKPSVLRGEAQISEYRNSRRDKRKNAEAEKQAIAENSINTSSDSARNHNPDNKLVKLSSRKKSGDR
ncbi:MAG: ATP-binding cassette domain-containing protein [Gammaproteobacteria bacterium]|nr:ATP-binding cassette domain-containing protein [Gammaproteobacteria bacterium]NNL11524.1 ATP-binding cassette domain-containing protein [Pseudomonadales bacterium]RZV56102.1 MAG: ATP-binding cassette domain-containing protein [Pseudomonadales bacterium]